MLLLNKRENYLGFSLLELLVVIAIIAILTFILIPTINGVSNASQTTVARQQQAELQSALGIWLVSQSSGPGGLAAARSAYQGNKKELLRNYLQESTYESLSSIGDDTIVSAALIAVRARLEFSSWNASSDRPRVNWINN